MGAGEHYVKSKIQYRDYIVSNAPGFLEGSVIMVSDYKKKMDTMT